MELTGCCFALDVPPAWRMETNDGLVIATSDESFAGFTPNVVLRESRLRRPEPTSLAAASQANLAVLSTQIPGSFFFHVEALPDANATPGPAERRRLWAFSTLKIPEAHGNALCLVMIQDLLVVGDVIAEVTATVPLMAWHRGSVYESILDSLRPLPPRARRVPHTDSDVFTVDLDDWASNRDGVPREKLDVQPDPVPALAGEIATLSEGAFKALDDLALLGYSKKTSKFSATGRELRRAGLIDDPGTLTETGEWVAAHLREGNRITALADTSPPQLLTFWINDMTSLVVIPVIDDSSGQADYLLGNCLVDDISRFLLLWAGVRPSWPMEFEYSFPQPELIAKLLADTPPRSATGSDAIEFSRQPWTTISLNGPEEEEPAIAWVTTSQRGAGILYEKDAEDRVAIARNSTEPLWQILGGMIRDFTQGGKR